MSSADSDDVEDARMLDRRGDSIRSEMGVEADMVGTMRTSTGSLEKSF